MDKKTRIKKDILMFEENLSLLKGKKLTESQKKTVELAKQYYKDSKYYLEKKDYFTILVLPCLQLLSQRLLVSLRRAPAGGKGSGDQVGAAFQELW